MGDDRICRAGEHLSEAKAAMIIAVDGPAASGKGTIARALADHYALPYLDTGLLYRAVGMAALRAGGQPANSEDALAGCGFGEAMLHDPDIRSEAASRAASEVSAHPAVRAALLERQLAFAAQPEGAVLDGRDIGTVIAPDANAKLFITATPEERAARRCRDIPAGDYDLILADILTRDARDAARATAPLVRAMDADLLDTTNLTICAAVQAAIALVEARLRIVKA